MAEKTQTFPNHSPDIHKDESAAVNVPSSCAGASEKGRTMSRREVFSSAAAVALPTAALATATVFPANDAPDQVTRLLDIETRLTEAEPSEIEAAYREYMRLEAELDKACVALDETEDELQEPKRPVYRFGVDAGNYDISSDDDGYGILLISCYDDDIEKLKWVISPNSLEDQELIERAKTTLKKIEQYLAERDRVRDASGFTAAYKALRQIEDAQQQVADRIFQTAPTTLRDVAFQATL